MTHPEEFTDTSPQAMEVWLNVLRNKKPGERMAMALAMSEFAIRLSESGVRARYPNASEREVFLACRCAAHSTRPHDPRLWVGSGRRWRPLLTLFGKCWQRWTKWKLPIP